MSMGEEEEVSLVYWEPQEAALCAVHAINNLVQLPCVDEWQLSQIAQELTQRERELMSESGVESREFLQFMAQDSHHVDDSGNFSVEVIRTALQNLGLKMEAFDAEVVQSEQADPLQNTGYICNLKSHWFAIRRLPTSHGMQWFNLDSVQRPAFPKVISDFYLDAFLKQLRTEGYSIFIVTGVWPRQPQSPSSSPSSSSLASSSSASSAGPGKYFTIAEIRRLTEAAKHQPNEPEPRGGRGRQQQQQQQQLQGFTSEEEMLEAAIRASMQDVQPTAAAAGGGRDENFEDEEFQKALALSLALGQGDPADQREGLKDLKDGMMEEDDNDDDDDDPELQEAFRLSMQEQ